MATLNNNNKTLVFEFGGQLDAWQIQSILYNAGGTSLGEISEYLSEKEGWNEKNINELVDFINSEEFNEMKF
ncbi:hypothetical protein [Tannerella forsythia]|uniref:hypothetical protein n=1 Tax=Tannerella forsythia TaxID=28112 RepID=UPI0028DB047D|nr:hypothetical protein [Tannerella forsythia]